MKAKNVLISDRKKGQECEFPALSFNQWLFSRFSSSLLSTQRVSLQVFYKLVNLVQFLWNANVLRTV